jgi:phage baseplate assembly protein W
MAFQVQQINPLDLQPSVGVGVALPFTSNVVFTTTYTTKDATKTNLINFLLTNPGERYFNPTFGAGLNQILFEQSTETTQDTIRFRIETGIAQYFPQVQVNTLEINADRDNNLVTIALSYSIVNTNVQDELLINIEI